MQFSSSSDLLFINTSAKKTKEDFLVQNSIESDIYTVAADCFYTSLMSL